MTFQLTKTARIWAQRAADAGYVPAGEWLALRTSFYATRFYRRSSLYRSIGIFDEVQDARFNGRKTGIDYGRCQSALTWGIAKACIDAGAELAFTYQGEALNAACPLAESVNAEIMPCDVTDDASWTPFSKS